MIEIYMLWSKIEESEKAGKSNLGHSVYTTQIPIENHNLFTMIEIYMLWGKNNLFTMPVWQTLVTGNVGGDAHIVFGSSRRCALLYPECHKTEKSTDPQQSREPSKQLEKKLHYLRRLFRWGNCIGPISLKDFCSFLLSQTLQ